MPDFTNNSASVADAASDSAVYARIQRAMAIAIALAVLGSLALSPWRITTGLLLGGALSLLNYSWMRSSIAAAFCVASTGRKPKIKIIAYVFRYFVIAATVYAAYKLNLVSLPATLVGMCSFVIGLFTEAFRGLYLTVVRREEIT